MGVIISFEKKQQIQVFRRFGNAKYNRGGKETLKKSMKTRFALLLVLMLIFTMLPFNKADAAKKVKLSAKKLSIQVGQTKTLKLKNNRQKVKWLVTSGKKKTVVKIIGKKVGSAKVQVKIGKKKYTCKMTVKVERVTTATAQPVVPPGATPKPTDSTISLSCSITI